MFWHILLLISLVFNVYAQENYLKKALDKQFFKDSSWKNILHIVDKKSEILDESFFLSHDKTAKSELISAFQGLHDKKIVCRFPARYNLLKEKFNISDDIVNIHSCQNINLFIKNLNTSSVSLVFTSPYFSAPGTMFGHTFLHLRDKSKNKLLGYSVSFAATVPDDESIIPYIYNGLTGKYTASYTLTNYYEKIKEYSDIEQRDVWEYNLNLTESQRLQMLYHIYELRDKTKKYTYMRMNCAYNLLWIIEVARGTTYNKHALSYLPSEIIQTFNDDKLIKSSTLTPSIQSKIIQNIKLLKDKKLIESIKKIAYDKISVNDFMLTDASIADKRLVLSSVILYMQYLVAVGDMKRSLYSSKFLTILQLRSKLGIDTRKKEYSFTPNSLYAHKTQKFSFNLGMKDGSVRSYLQYRLGYHSLDDIVSGFAEGSEVVYFDIKAEIKKKRVTLNKFTLLRLSSLTPISELFKPISWQSSLSLDRTYLDNRLYTHFHLGIGRTYSFHSITSYFLLNAHFLYAKNINSAVSFKYGILFGNNYNTLHFDSELLYYSNGYKQLRLFLNESYKISKNFNITATVSSVEKYTYTQNNFEVGLSLFF